MKGIDFTATLRAAVREGRKTVTRRLMKPQPAPDVVVVRPPIIAGGRWQDFAGELCGGLGQIYTGTTRKPRYRPGEVVYVREPWCLLDADFRPVQDRQDGCVVVYRDDHLDQEHGDGPDRLRWRPARFMPAWAARTRLRILSVRPERLQDITEDECALECVPFEAFPGLWDTLHPDPGTTWADSPWAWRVEFEVVR